MNCKLISLRYNLSKRFDHLFSPSLISLNLLKQSPFGHDPSTFSLSKLPKISIKMYFETLIPNWLGCPGRRNPPGDFWPRHCWKRGDADNRDVTTHLLRGTLWFQSFGEELGEEEGSRKCQVLLKSYELWKKGTFIRPNSTYTDQNQREDNKRRGRIYRQNKKNHGGIEDNRQAAGETGNQKGRSKRKRFEGRENVRYPREDQKDLQFMGRRFEERRPGSVRGPWRRRDDPWLGEFGGGRERHELIRSTMLPTGPVEEMSGSSPGTRRRTGKRELRYWCRSWTLKILENVFWPRSSDFQHMLSILFVIAELLSSSRNRRF